MKKTIIAIVMIAAMAVGNASAHTRVVNHHHHGGSEIGHFVAGAILGAAIDHIITTAVEATPVVVAEPAPVREVVVHHPAPIVVHRHHGIIEHHHGPAVHHHGPAVHHHEPAGHHRPGHRMDNHRPNQGHKPGHHDNRPSTKHNNNVPNHHSPNNHHK